MYGESFTRPDPADTRQPREHAVRCIVCMFPTWRHDGRCATHALTCEHRDVNGDPFKHDCVGE